MIWQRHRFLKLLKCCVIQENDVPIIPPPKKSWTEILPFISHQKIKEISVLSLGRMGLVSAAAQSSHFLHYSRTKRDANLDYFHFSAQYQAQVFQNSLFSHDSSFLSKRAWDTALTAAICIWTFTFLLCLGFGAVLWAKFCSLEVLKARN